MNLLSMENITKSYVDKVLFDSISIGIHEGEKIGLLGINGTGKTTLLKIIAELEQPDQGKITMRNGIQVTYMPQNPSFDEEATVIQQVFAGNSPVMTLLRQYENTLLQLEEFPESKSLRQKLQSIELKLDALDGWQTESEAKAVLTKLGMTDFTAQVGTLSGGQRKRLALATALVEPADLLLLDEPTNHIDNDTVAWLEQYLKKRKGALLMVTHDRYFLDRVVNRILELDQGKLFSYPGNYSAFLTQKLEREAQLESSERKRKNLLRTELEWIKKGAKARTTKQKARIMRFEKLQAEKPLHDPGKIEITAGSSRLGNKVIDVYGISKQYNEVPLVSDFTYSLQREARIGVVGPNGIGKTTLLQMIAGRLQPDYGHVEIGQTVKIGCFMQENTSMDEDLRVIEYIKEEAEYLPTKEGKMLSAAQMLERFLFTPTAQWTPIAKLSGGERRRLYLLRVLMGAPNVLLLDEPTNDLDIHTLTILEDYLDDFPGAVLTISHDRYFLDRVVDEILAFEGNGVIKQYSGNYSEYQKARAQEQAEIALEVGQSQVQEIKSEERKAKRPLKFSYKEQREFEEIDAVIANLEQEVEAIKNKINEASSNYELLQELVQTQEDLEQQLNEKVERWAYLHELAEKIAKNSLVK